MQDQTRPRDAGLALIVKDRPRRAVDGRFKIGVLEHDVRALPAQFQLNALEVAGRGFNNPATGRRRAGEGDLADVRMLGQRLPGGIDRKSVV
mgnify:CR=1 FL=1